jgi:hypothetical protein
LIAAFKVNDGKAGMCQSHLSMDIIASVVRTAVLELPGHFLEFCFLNRQLPVDNSRNTTHIVVSIPSGNFRMEMGSS